MFNQFFRTSMRQLHSNGFRGFPKSGFQSAFSINASRAIKTANPRLGLLLGATGSFLAVNSISSITRPVLNDVINKTPADQLKSDFNVAKAEATKQIHKSRLSGSLNYNELCIGSISGLLLGVIAGKLSHVIVILTLSSYFLVQFLESRGIVTIPWRKIIKVGSENIDVKTMIFDQPSFKISFVSTFIIAALNI